MSKDDWLKFFMEAGIPQKDALGYAVKFAHNRIQINMLPELNKEYLKEMDITILGDVISILRHAKIVHDKTIKEKVLLENSSLSSCKANVSAKCGTQEKEQSDNILKKKTSSATTDVPKPSLKSTVKSVGTVCGKSSNRRKMSDEDDDVCVKKKNRIESPKKKVNSSMPLSVEEEEIEEFEDMGYIFGPLSPQHQDIIENRNDSNKRFKLSNSGIVPMTMKHDNDNCKPDDTSNCKILVNKPTIGNGNTVERLSNMNSNKTISRKTIGGNADDSIANTSTTVTTLNASVNNKEENAVASKHDDDDDHNNNNDDDDDDDDDDDYDDDDDDQIQVIIDDPYFPYYDMRAQLNFNRMEKFQQFKETAKKKVFERLGDETCQNSVTSTTNMGDDDVAPPTDENVSHENTSLVSQNSVFFRLGDKNDSLRNQLTTAEELRVQITEDNEYDDNESIAVDTTQIKSTTPVHLNDENNSSPECDSADFGSSDISSPSYKLHLNMESEGILANPLNEQKLSLKHRLGYNTKAFRDKQITDLRKSGLYHKDKFKKQFPATYMDSEMEKAKKKVKFGKVTQKIIPNKEEAIRNGELPRISSSRASVFARLGYNIR